MPSRLVRFSFKKNIALLPLYYNMIMINIEWILNKMESKRKSYSGLLNHIIASYFYY